MGKQHSKVWRGKNIDKVREYNKEYYKEHKEEIAEQHRRNFKPISTLSPERQEKKRKWQSEYRNRNRDRLKEYHKLWRDDNKEHVLGRSKEWKHKRKLIVMEHYSNGKLECDCCGENIYEFLTIDHIDGGGSKHRKELKGNSMYDWIIANDFPNNFRVLCMNCNYAKRFGDKCPHEELS